MKYENFTFVSFPSLTLIFSRILCLWFQLLISVLLLSPNLWFNPFFGIRFSVQVGRYLKKETRNLSVHIVQTITNGSHEPGLMSLLKEEIKTLCMPEYPSTPRPFRGSLPSDTLEFASEMFPEIYADFAKLWRAFTYYSVTL